LGCSNATHSGVILSLVVILTFFSEYKIISLLQRWDLRAAAWHWGKPFKVGFVVLLVLWGFIAPVTHIFLLLLLLLQNYKIRVNTMVVSLPMNNNNDNNQILWVCVHHSMRLYTQKKSTMTRLNIWIIDHKAFLFIWGMKQQLNSTRKRKTGDLSHFCLWMKMFVFKIKKLTTYSRIHDFGFSL